MSEGIIVLAMASAILTTAILALRRRRERSTLEAWAQRHGWSLERMTERDLDEALSGAVLMQLGHSRRVLNTAKDPQGVRIFEYAFETGLENDHRIHYLIAVMVPLSTSHSRAMITDQRQMLAAASGPAYRRASVGTAQGAHQAMVSDEEAWAAEFRGAFGARMRQEPAGRSWEVLPHQLLGYQGGPVPDAAIAGLVSSGKELAQQLQ